MPWLLALIGAFLGALVGSAGSALAGFVGGALLGWQQARIGELRRRLDSLELRRIPTPQRTTPLTPEQAQAIRDTGAPPAQSKPPVEAPVREAAFVPQTVAPPQEAQVRKHDVLLEGRGKICLGSTINDGRSECLEFEHL